MLRDAALMSASVSRPPKEAARARTGLPDHRYYTTAELDSRPGVVTRIEPQYPERAARRHLSGKVRIRLFIDPAGVVERVVALQADPPGYFEAAAEQAFQGARFTPGRKDGRPVRVQITLEISFDSPEPPAAPG